MERPKYQLCHRIIQQHNYNPPPLLIVLLTHLLISGNFLQLRGWLFQGGPLLSPENP